MTKLNLPEYPYRIRTNKDGKHEIHDPVRKKFVRLTPEEWVRQNFLNFLVSRHNYPASLIHVEASLTYNRLSKRSDIVVYGNHGKPLLAVECKAPSVEITQLVFDQLAMYNFTLKVSYLVLTNGIQHYICQMEPAKGRYTFLEEFPDYNELHEQFQE
ncbi:MAG: type I restriction enzyme HsdR N-terminal domain-containing protein [Bacteroidetes bacterium]|nr:type I restriction enzyme HsdR N-terminal domain-containing protein [Bacteroidota bacterium]